MLTSIYEYTDYRVFLETWLSKQSGKGLRGKLAKAMGVSSSMLSLILNGSKNLSLEQANECLDFLGLNDREADYFFLLVELGRAGSHKLKLRLKTKISEQQSEAKKISKRLKKDLELNDEQKAIYYSSWVYTGIRNLSALESFHDAHSIASRLQIPLSVVNQTLDFLINHGLCKIQDGKLTYGPAYTHVGNDSPFVVKHHQNWRIRGFQFMEQNLAENLYYTCPMSLSKDTAEELRKHFVDVIQDVWKRVGPSKSEEVYCLNLDWFKF